MEVARNAAGLQTTRRRLLAAAEQVIIQHGSAALTVRRVGEAAGLNPTLVTYHFGTMAGLLGELCEANLAPMRQAWAGLDGSRVADPLDLLQAWLAPLLFPAAFSSEGRALAVLDELASHAGPDLATALQEEMAGVGGRVRAAIGPHLPHLGDEELRQRLRFIAGAALGPPPRSRMAGQPDAGAALAALVRFAATGLELPRPSL